MCVCEYLCVLCKGPSFSLTVVYDIYIYTHTHLHIHTYIHIYISYSSCTLYIYIYIYTNTQIHAYTHTSGKAQSYSLTLGDALQHQPPLMSERNGNEGDSRYVCVYACRYVYMYVSSVRDH